MISRDRLMAGLEELIYVEEGMVTFFANFAKAMVRQSDGLEAEKAGEIKHIAIAKQLISYVSG